MGGLKTIVTKELTDHCSSYRFLLLFALIAMVSLTTVYMASVSIARDLEGTAKPPWPLWPPGSSSRFFSPSEPAWWPVP